MKRNRLLGGVLTLLMISVACVHGQTNKFGGKKKDEPRFTMNFKDAP